MRFTLWGSSFRGDDASCRGLTVPTFRAVGHGLATALYQGAKAGLDVRQPGGDKGTVAVVQLAAPGSRGRALRPAPSQRALRITPTNQLLQALEVRRITHVVAEHATLFVSPEDPRNAPLAFTSSSFQGGDVVSLEVAVLAIQERRKLVQRAVLIRHEATESFAAGCLIHPKSPIN